MNKILKTLGLGAAVLIVAAGCSQKSETDRKVDRLLAQMTLQEKIGQMNQLSGGANLAEAAAAGQVGSILNCVSPEEINIVQKAAVEQSRLGIPVIVSRDVIHGFHTVFPIPLGQAATFDPEIVERGARVAAVEASAAGIRWTFSPMLDVSRDPRWGRVAEGSGLSGRRPQRTRRHSGMHQAFRGIRSRRGRTRLQYRSRDRAPAAQHLFPGIQEGS